MTVLSSLVAEPALWAALPLIGVMLVVMLAGISRPEPNSRPVQVAARLRRRRS
jgi:hypothetical protein